MGEIEGTTLPRPDSDGCSTMVRRYRYAEMARASSPNAGTQIMLIDTTNIIEKRERNRGKGGHALFLLGPGEKLESGNEYFLDHN
jgi:hypothetical protein